MKKILLTAMIALAVPMMAEAKTMKFPSQSPVVSIKFPDDWSSKETKTGVDSTSDDQTIYVSADVADISKLDNVVTEAVGFLKNNGITIDASTLKETPAEDFNGMQMATLDWDGTDKDDEPVSIGLAIIQTSAKHGLVITYWGEKDGEDEHSKELVSILASIKPLK